MTTVLVTHDQEEALDVADRIAVLNKGRIEQVGDPVTLYDRPANDFVMSFLGSVARLGGQLVRPHDIALDRDRDRALAAGRPRRPDRPASSRPSSSASCGSASRCGSTCVPRRPATASRRRSPAPTARRWACRKARPSTPGPRGLPNSRRPKFRSPCNSPPM